MTENGGRLEKLDGAWYYFQSWGGVYRDAFYTVKMYRIILMRTENGDRLETDR